MSNFSLSCCLFLAIDAIVTADHYGSAEILFGQFRKAALCPDKITLGDGLPSSPPNIPPVLPSPSGPSSTLPSPPLCATKWCIFKSHFAYNRTRVEDGVRERMRRTMGNTIDLLQVHWQQYDDPDYLNVFRHLIDIKRDGQLEIRALGLVNFDSRRVDEICEAIGPGELVTNQVQVCVRCPSLVPPSIKSIKRFAP